MRSSEPTARRSAEVGLTVAVLVALFAALMPLLRVVESGPWVLGSMVLSAGVLGAGFAARWFRLAAIAVTLVEVVVWIILITLVFLRETALFALFPTPASVRQAQSLVTVAIDDVVNGAAPLEAGAGLSFVIVGAMGVLAIIIDHVVLTARMPLLAGVGLIAISLIPSIVVPGKVDVTSFVLLAATLLYLLRADTRTREEPVTGRSASAGSGTGAGGARANGGVTATAVGIGAIGLIVAIVVTPLLPEPTRVGSGFGRGATIDLTLQLGDDLRRPSEVEVLRVRSSAPNPPYLRAATLSEFSGSVWQPDRPRSVPLAQGAGLGAVTVDDDIALAEYATNVDVVNLSSPWLPVAFPAVSVTGLSGDWRVVPENRTVLTQNGSAQGQAYEVITEQPRPTLEQIRALRAGGPDMSDQTTALPADLPPVIGELAAEVTADAFTDYDRLLALQTWFRGSSFSYSLEAPVEDGFDGSGAAAVADFLDVRKGYCVHFASAYALMARTLGMPSRIVVGYLPGTNTNSSIESRSVYSISSGQLHAWPEVFFGGVGWIAFEPTNSLGTPTSFSPAASGSDLPKDDASAAPLPEDSARPDASLDPTDDGLNPDDLQAGSANSPIDPLPVLTALLGVLLALAIPGLIRELRRRQLLAAARSGDAAAAWTSVQDVAIDLGITVPGGETPRSFGTRLMAQHGAPVDEMTALLSGIERASYGPGGRYRQWQGSQLADEATAVRAGMLASVSTRERLIALLAPRSLIVRPGSVYADRSAARLP